MTENTADDDDDPRKEEEYEQTSHPERAVSYTQNNRARQLYKNISMLFLFPVKDGKLSTGVNATFNTSRLVFNNLKLPYKTIV